MQEEKMEIVDLYREIGNEFRKYGAEKVILLHVRNESGNQKKMKMEVAIDGMKDSEILLKTARNLWPWIEMQVIVLNEQTAEELLREVYEDGILI